MTWPPPELMREPLGVKLPPTRSLSPPSEDGPADGESPLASWQPVELGPYLRGEIRQPTPESLLRTDGVCLLYPRKVHWISGEPEGCKSWLAFIAIAERLDAGLPALFIDFEGEPEAAIERLRALGVTDQAIGEHFTYVRPETVMTGAGLDSIRETMTTVKPMISVIDGVNAAMGSSGYNPSDGKDFYRWWGQLGSLLKRHTDGPILAIDHVPKDPDNRGPYASGTVQKQAAIDVHFGIEVVSRFGIGLTGKLRLMLHKDRAGRLRQHEAPDTAIGVLVLESNAETLAVHFAIEPPTQAGKAKDDFRPTHLMEKVSRYLEETDQPQTKERIKQAKLGKTEWVVKAVSLLHEEGFLGRDERARYPLYSSLKPYREEAEEDGSE